MRRYFDYYDGVHADLAKEYRWFVRNCGDLPYYLNGSYADVITDTSIHVSCEIVDNEWTGAEYAARPAGYNVITFEDRRIVTEVYHNAAGAEPSYKRNGVWLLRRYYDGETGSYVNWTEHDDYTTFGYRLGTKLKYVDGRFYAYTSAAYDDLGEKLPYGLRTDDPVKLVNELRRKRHAGGYEDLAQAIMRICGVHHTEVKEALY